MKWQITYHSEKVRSWVDKMPIGMRAYYARITERLVKMGPNLGMPFTRVIEKDLFELRIKAKEGISRIFYCTVKHGKIVMLHGLDQKTPQKELKTVRQRKNEVMQ